MDYLFSIIDKVGLSFAVAFFTGIGMGVYLAAVNQFIPVRSVTKSFITNIVIGVSFFVPIFLQRVTSGEPDTAATADRWAAALLLWLVFSMTADAVNYILCHRRKIWK